MPHCLLYLCILQRDLDKTWISIKAYLRAFTHGINFFTTQLEGEMVEPYFRRLVLRSVAHIIRLYSSSLITECEVQY